MRHFYPWEEFQAATTIKLEAVQTAATLANLSTRHVAAVQAYITVDTAPVRIGYGGLVPVGDATGHRIDKGETIVLKGWDEMKYFQHIRDGSTDAVMWVTYKYPKHSHSRG